MLNVSGDGANAKPAGWHLLNHCSVLPAVLCIVGGMVRCAPDAGPALRLTGEQIAPLVLPRVVHADNVTVDEPSHHGSADTVTLRATVWEPGRRRPATHHQT